MAVLIAQNVYPAARVSLAANLPLTDNVEKYIDWTVDNLDPWGMHDLLTDPNRLTILVPGTYIIGGLVAFDVSSVGIRYLRVRLNGTTTLAKSQFTAFGASGGAAFSVSTIYSLSAGDYLEMSAYQNSGGSLNVIAASPSQPVFWAARLPGS